MKQLILVCFFLMMLGFNCFAQFPYLVQLGSKPKGSVDSIVTTYSSATNISVFNKQGQLIRVYQTPFLYSFTRIDEVRDTIVYHYYYGQGGRLLTVTSYYNGKSKSVYTTAYDYLHTDSGLVIKAINVPYNREVLLDKFENIVQTKGYPIPGLSDVSTYKYNRKGYVVQETQIPPQPHPSRHTFYKYYANGYLKQRIRRRRQLIFKYTYPKYDKMGNWITQYIYNEGELIDSVTRRITYHK